MTELPPFPALFTLPPLAPFVPPLPRAPEFKSNATLLGCPWCDKSISLAGASSAGAFDLLAAHLRICNLSWFKLLLEKPARSVQELLRAAHELLLAELRKPSESSRLLVDYKRQLRIDTLLQGRIGVR